MEWTNADIECLIDYYDDHHFLYDVTDVNYHNRVKRHLAVTELAGMLRTTGLCICISDDYMLLIIILYG